MIRQKIVLTMLLFCFSLITVAQTNFSTQQTDYELSGVDFISIEGKSKLLGAVSYERCNFQISLPILLKKPESYLFHNLNYSKTKIVSGKIIYGIKPNTNANVEDFHSVGYTFGYSCPLKRDWMLTAIISPSVSSNFESGLKMKEIQLYGMAVFSKAIGRKNNLILNLGVLSSPKFGLIPIVSAVWQPAPKWNLNIGFPEFDIKYQATPTTTVGANVFIDGDQFTFSKDAVYEPNKKKVDGLSVLNIGTAVYLNQKIAKSINLKLNTGFTVHREFEFKKGNDKVVGFNLDDDIFVKIGFSIDI